MRRSGVRSDFSSFLRSSFCSSDLSSKIGAWVLLVLICCLASSLMAWFSLRWVSPIVSASCIWVFAVCFWASFMRGSASALTKVITWLPIPSSVAILLISWPVAIPEGSIRIFFFESFKLSRTSLSDPRSLQQMQPWVNAVGLYFASLSASMLKFPISLTITSNASPCLLRYSAIFCKRVVFPAPRVQSKSTISLLVFFVCVKCLGFWGKTPKFLLIKDWFSSFAIAISC